MGNIESKYSGCEFLREFASGYTFLKEINDKRFGDLIIYKSKSEERYVAKRNSLCNSTEEYQVFLRQCKERIKLTNENIIQLLFAQETNQEQLCGDFNKVTLYFEYFTHDLEKELIRRQDIKEAFTEPELWYLLNSLVQACRFFQKQNIYHGDIRPINVLLTQEGFVKIADHGIIHVDQNNYLKILSNRSERVFLSPIQMQYLREGELKPIHDFVNNFYCDKLQAKSDVFSLGLTLLAAALLQNPISVYDYQNCQIQYNLLQQFFTSARKRYSEFLVGIIKEMVTFDQKLRPSFEDLENLLQPYQENIINFQQIQPQINQEEQYIPHFGGQNQTPVKVQQFQNQQYTPQQVQTRMQMLQQHPSEIFQQPPSNILMNQTSSFMSQPPTFQLNQSIKNTDLSQIQPAEMSQVLAQSRQSDDQSFHSHSFQTNNKHLKTIPEQYNINEIQTISHQSYENQYDDPTLSDKDMELNEIDKKVKMAIKQSEETIRRHADINSVENSRRSQGQSQDTLENVPQFHHDKNIIQNNLYRNYSPQQIQQNPYNAYQNCQNTGYQVQGQQFLQGHQHFQKTQQQYLNGIQQQNLYQNQRMQ